MSYGFSNVRVVKGRRQYVCEQCRRLIPAGEPHCYAVGKWDGDFYAAREHTDCRKLWLKLWDARGLGGDDTQDMLCWDGDLHEDKSWITVEFPNVAARLWPDEGAA
mgnify:CR=1 FL=1